MTPLKQIILGLTALLAVVLVVCVLVINHLDLDRYKHRIEQMVFDKTNRQLQIDGPVNVRVFPWVGLRLQDVTFGNAAGFSDNEFASAQSSELQLELLPLLVGKLKVKKLELQNLSLHLRRDADGKTNWDDLMSNTAVVETESDGDVVQEVEAGTPLIAALSIGGLHIVDSDFSYTDAREDSQFSLHQFNLSTGTILLSEPFGFESQFDFVSSDGAGIASEINASGELALNLADNIYRLQNLQLATNNRGGALLLDQLPVNLEGDIVARLNDQTVDFNMTAGSVLGVPVTGEVQIDEGKGWLTGTLTSADFDVIDLLQQSGHLVRDQKYNSDRLQMGKANLRMTFFKQDDELNIRNIESRLGDIDIKGDVQINNLSGSSVLSGRFETGDFNPATWLPLFDLPVPAKPVMQNARIATSVRKSGQLLAFNQLDLQLDESSITGDIEVSDINADVPPLNFAIAIDQINLDRYLPLDAEVRAIENDDTSEPDATGSNTESGADAGAVTDLPVPLLREISLSGEVAVGQLTVAGVTAQSAVIPVRAKAGKLEIAEAKAELYQGSFHSSVSLDVQSEEPLLTVTSNLNGVSAEPFLKDFLHGEAPLTGTANINVDLLSRGGNGQQLLERANGAVSARLTDGVVNGIDISSELQRAGNILFNRDEDVLPDTAFSELSVSAVLADGVMQSDDLVVESPLLSLSGEGGVNLAKESIDYLLHVRVSDTQDNESAGLLRDMAGIELSLPVRGSFSDLSVDFARLLRQAFETGLVEQIKDRLLDRQTSETTTRIEAEKAALRERLEKEQEEATALIREKKQQVEKDVEVQTQSLEKKLEQKKEALKEKLEENLIKGLGDLLGEQ